MIVDLNKHTLQIQTKGIQIKHQRTSGDQHISWKSLRKLLMLL